MRQSGHWRQQEWRTDVKLTNADCLLNNHSDQTGNRLFFLDKTQRTFHNSDYRNDYFFKKHFPSPRL
jgi:hypothetical protein